ncbi:sugar ABC transporter substrate-binding protein [Corynebacterium phocae]|uniref:Sugar ABC transporter substrate-binding protein n=1 Tax=Corynebacterium phocae TaxID=161895 RepID=A0A1L7D1Y7_9CORY|nr:Fur family transcriptional regulator [Corynebacterium phocae]APT92118.1 sugar ABC transporter substrate-binding protein [Corynebacterium phocae]KAA8726505.1 transcriptional repressor [Corynebacterium phocae]
MQQKIPKLGARNTRQRTAVIKVLRDFDNFASAKDIYNALQVKEAKVGLTTVYRTLQSLSEIDAVDALHMPSGETLYRHCDSLHHHHHLVCIRCGRTEEVDGGPIEEWAKSISEQHGFELTGHDAEIFGVCGSCQTKLKTAPKS